MPGESGLSLYQKMRGDDQLKGIPVLISSALNISKELGDIAYSILPDGTNVPEPDGVVEKPVTAEQFVAAVNKLIRNGNAD